jgi:putative FmdB family regulatory protein
MAEVSNGGQSTSDARGRASTRPNASRTGTCSSASGVQAPRIAASASDTVIIRSFYGPHSPREDRITARIPAVPIYEYVCAKCARRTEVIQGMNDRPPKSCPHCGGKLKKAASAPAFHLKGSGWYKTDYASPAGKALEKSDKSDRADDAKTSESSEKSEKAGASEKVEKSEKGEKGDKSEKTEKKDKKTMKDSE